MAELLRHFVVEVAIWLSKIMRFDILYSRLPVAGIRNDRNGACIQIVETGIGEKNKLWLKILSYNRYIR